MITMTLKEAAEATGKTKVALLKSIQKGKFSACKNPMGEWEIQPSELFRVYKPLVLPKDENLPLGSEQEAKFLSDKVAILERERAFMAALIDDLLAERENWRKSAEVWQTQICTLLEDGRKKEDIRKDNTSWLKKLFG